MAEKLPPTPSPCALLFRRCFVALFVRRRYEDLHGQNSELQRKYAVQAVQYAAWKEALVPHEGCMFRRLQAAVAAAGDPHPSPCLVIDMTLIIVAWKPSRQSSS